jgi:hypothetical protein
MPVVTGICSHFVLTVLTSYQADALRPTDRVQQLVQVVDDALMEAIELATLGIWQRGVSAKRLEQACGQGCVDSFKEFQEDEGNRVPLGPELVSARVWQFVDQPFGP